MKALGKKPPYIQYPKNGKKEIATSGNWEHYRNALLELADELDELCMTLNLSMIPKLEKQARISAGEEK